MIRRGGPQDIRFLRDMLRHAFYWPEIDPESGERPVWRYVQNWGRPGDAAVIAIDAGFPVGAAWYRLFPRNEPGYGFVDESTPELAIAVVPSRRGQGIGKELLEGLLQRAREEGFRALSLSVAKDNPAVSLYQRYGFRKVAESDRSYTMTADLAPTAAAVSSSK
jgi:ribosomal protein S18 acetylase RimI-like enzyme